MAIIQQQRKRRRWSSDHVVVATKKRPNRPLNPASAKRKEVRPSPQPAKKKTIDQDVFDSIARQVNAMLPEPPFKIGIGNDIVKKLAGTCGISTKLLRRIVNIHMRYLTGLERYLQTASNATHRHDLDGGRSEMEQAHRKEAQIRLKRLKAKQSRPAAKKYQKYRR